MALKNATQLPKTTNKPPKSQSSKTSQALFPDEMLWSQQVELEKEEASLHSSFILSPSGPIPNKMLSLYYEPSDPSKPIKATQFPATTRSQTFKQVTKANPSQKELASSSSFSNKQIVVAANPTPLSTKSRYWQNDLNQSLLVIER